VAVKRSNRRKPGKERGDLLFEDEERSAGFSQILSYALAGLGLVGAVAFAGLQIGKHADARSVSGDEWVDVISPTTNLVRKSSFVTTSPSSDLVITVPMRPQAVLASAKADLLGDDLVVSPAILSDRTDLMVLTPPVWKIEKTWRLGKEQKQKVLGQRAQRLSEANCLARAVYFEARSESELGQLAVAQVVLNRVKNPDYPKSICDVVYQGASRMNSCQFSFACDGASDNPRPGDAWNQAQRVANRALAGDGRVQVISTATNYHADYVKPRWSDSLNRLIKIGRHIFYTDG
jgi:hypothetical protein